MPDPTRYRSTDEDSTRWLGFPFRRGDIVISTRSKSGTTWMQMICALLVFESPDLPAPLAELSPWLDWKVEAKQDVWDRMAAQNHRRFIKTHTPLDGLPAVEHVSYVVVARHPLDAAVSLYHQGENIDREKMAELTGAEPSTRPRRALGEWLRDWIRWDGLIADNLDSLPGFMWHLGDAWRRRSEPNVVLAHYADLLSDLEGEMVRLAGRLGFAASPDAVRELAQYASFDFMKSRSGRFAPDPVGVLRDTDTFFRRGRSGAGQELLPVEEVAFYRSRVAQLIPPDLDAWLHR